MDILEGIKMDNRTECLKVICNSIGCEEVNENCNDLCSKIQDHLKLEKDLSEYFKDADLEGLLIECYKANIRFMLAFSRPGISFTKKQIKLIKRYSSIGNSFKGIFKRIGNFFTGKAQKIILDKLEEVKK